MNLLPVISRKVALFGAFIFFLSPAMWAQKKAEPKIDQKQVPVFCDQIPNQVKKDLKIRANQECRTVYHCYECTSRISGKKICVPVAVQPDKSATCGVVEPVTDPKKELPAKENLTGAPDFKLDFIANWCFAGGVTLKALVLELPESGPDSEKNYQYLWTVDGKKVGDRKIVNCITGKQAELTVTQVATGRTHSLQLNISKSTTGGNSTKPVAVYAKSSCFGKCPAYTVEFFANGTAKWNGLSNVGPKGRKTAKIPDGALNKIREKAAYARFFDLDDQYPKEQIVDAQSTTFYLNLDGREKQVVSIVGAPEGLQQLDQLFLEIVRSMGWAGEDTGGGGGKDKGMKDAPKN